jgi:hypothetical protein
MFFASTKNIGTTAPYDKTPKVAIEGTPIGYYDGTSLPISNIFNVTAAAWSGSTMVTPKVDDDGNLILKNGEIQYEYQDLTTGDVEIKLNKGNSTASPYAAENVICKILKQDIVRAQLKDDLCLTLTPAVTDIE